MYSCCTAFGSGEYARSNNVDFFSRLRRITSGSGKRAARLRAAGLDAHHAVVAREQEVLLAQFLSMGFDRLEHVDDDRRHLLVA
jgi:hypothetical protein